MKSLRITVGAIVTDAGNTAQTETGSWRTFRPVVDVEKCTGCGICWIFCPEPAIEEGKPAVVDYKYCKGCGICANECPFKAITMVPEGRG